MSAVAVQITQAVGRSALLAPLAHASYRRFWVGNALMLACDQMQIVALAILILDVTSSAATLGAVLTVVAIPRTVLMLIGGVATDRFRARTILLATNVCLAVTITLLGVSAAVSGIATWHLFLYAAIYGTLGAFVLPAGQSILADLVPAADVRGANALGTTTVSFASFLIPPIAGILVANVGVGTACIVIVLVLLGSAMCLWSIRSAEATMRIPTRTNSLEQLRDGFIATWRSPILRVFVASSTIFSLGFYGVTLVGIPAIAKQVLEGGDAGVGYLYGANGAGALIGATTTGVVKFVPRPGLVIAFTLVMTGSSFAMVSLAPTPIVAAALLAIAGATHAVCTIMTVAIILANAAADVRGRVMSVFLLGAFGLSPVSVWIGGLIAEGYGSQSVFVIGGIAVVTAGAYCLSRSACRRIV